MKVEFKKTFLKDIKKLKNERLRNAIRISIVQVEAADNLSEIKNLKKLTGYDIYYRIRVGDYRIGLKLQEEVLYFVVFEHRKNIYKIFP